MKKINQKLIKKSIRNIIIALGDNPDRPGLIDTPDRVARMYEEVFAGMNYTNDEIAEMFNKCFEEADSDEVVIVKDIPIFSYCEHHLALMYNMTVSIAYIPNKKVIGLSKVARIADMVGKRLQLQERIGTDISYILRKVCNTENMMVVVQGEHSCMTARGIKSRGSKTVTSCLSGSFKTNDALRSEAYALLKNN